MKKNVGNVDRILRVILGLALLAFAFLGPEGIRMWGFIGVVPLATGIINFCPLYTLLGINTCSLKK
ncbi:MAG: DUF2892 domain-containing protein [Bdellovibrionaceae bacterium]|nr:DUF2892 domain-containing protein [Pseudobdellovibrionaceae bacterium]NUM57545.1 DUF2892 domain-containing protein [Pseudobdellovibrionaceae bacterium]